MKANGNSRTTIGIKRHNRGTLKYVAFKMFGGSKLVVFSKSSGNANDFEGGLQDAPMSCPRTI